ncbi:MopE-related protein [Nannocystis pusilla]|uniref:MopE-related protein n=1 Tax=Nannocystis pusilla TaxID=889268 RepID=UPI003B7C39DA
MLGGGRGRARRAGGRIPAPELEQPPIEFWVEECDDDSDCPFDVPLCDLGPVPNVCVECLEDADCDSTEVCDPLTSTCECEADGPELCDGLDNDCDGDIDEDFAIGDPCEVGVGECVVEGALVCDDFGDVVCDAVPGPPAFELCDGLDNDCDGAVDIGCAKCEVDLECGGPFSGRICVVGFCVDGCRGVGNFCPLGLECSSGGVFPGQCFDPDLLDNLPLDDPQLDDLVDEGGGGLVNCACGDRPGDREGPWLLILAALARPRRARAPWRRPTAAAPAGEAACSRGHD